ncbi:MAG: AMP-binding protein [Alphaproteobacteria bacterium]|jgi:crotonobetaine/carnitine-CoA ligase|nr:AMP-binding protein [Alphaproteobacteria bacterium]MDP6567309.1 AMP-binding protein [Alphaproteobacteria bacterium]MDP6811900.1 AMP-binding protein [Alphaproteobacteria bacterium]
MVYDPRMPAPGDCVLGALLEKWAGRKPDDTALIFESGESWSWAETLHLTRRAAGGLRALGVRRGEHVLSWQPNGREAILTWFGLNYLGAVYVPVNTAYKGNLLQHVVQLSDAKLMVCHAELAPRLNEIDTGALADVIVTNGQADLDRLAAHDADSLLAADDAIEIEAPVEPWDTMYIIFTSGTTGPSKAVLSSYIQTYAMGVEANDYLGENDRILVNLPLFHVGGTLFVMLTAANGGSCLIVDSFSTETFWPTIRQHGVTATCFVGAMTPFLLKQPPSNHDKDHTLRCVVTVPWNEDSLAVAERYGFEMRTAFNMTEISSPIVSGVNPKALGTCGSPRPGVEVRVVDENDCEVAPGEVGELIVRVDRPWSMNHGYYKNPEATAEAWRNGWFHTGDAFRYDAQGNFYFVDRIKDAIRRRGENISSFEVESEVTAHAAVAEAAAIPVPSEFNEDEVMVVVSAAPEHQVDPRELFHFLEPRMAHFMLPRYIRVMNDLPKTPTQKIQKNLLREDGITTDTWDREAHGIKVKRQKLGAGD